MLVLSIAQFADVDQIAAQVGFQGFRMRVGFEVGVAGEADVADGVENSRKFDGTFSQVMRVVFEVDLADAVLAEPANFRDRVETGLGGVTDVVINLQVFGGDFVEDAGVVLG